MQVCEFEGKERLPGGVRSSEVEHALKDPVLPEPVKDDLAPRRAFELAVDFVRTAAQPVDGEKLVPREEPRGARGASVPSGRPSTAIRRK